MTAAGPDVQPLNSYPGMRPQAIQIPVASLKGPLGGDFGTGGTTHAGTITGYEFRNARNKPAPACLGAVDTGPDAGQGDPVQALSCSSLPSEIWIPVQWEEDHEKSTWLVNYKYQSMCLNVNAAEGQDSHAQLWACYYDPSGPYGLAANEAWDFGDWYANMQSGINPYPLFLGSGDFCLGADQNKDNDLPDGTAISISNYRSGTADQYWS
jgi:hypothetical protein